MPTQILTGTHTAGGRVVKATPAPGQHVDATTVDTSAVVHAAATGEDGSWSLTLLQGVVYDIKIERWGLKTIRVTDDAEKEFTTYLDANSILLAGPTIGTMKYGSKYIKPVLVDDAGNVVDPSNIPPNTELTLAWEIL